MLTKIIYCLIAIPSFIYLISCSRTGECTEAGEIFKDFEYYDFSIEDSLVTFRFSFASNEDIVFSNEYLETTIFSLSCNYDKSPECKSVINTSEKVYDNIVEITFNQEDMPEIGSFMVLDLYYFNYEDREKYMDCEGTNRKSHYGWSGKGELTIYGLDSNMYHVKNTPIKEEYDYRTVWDEIG